MASNPAADDRLQLAWQGQEGEGIHMSMDEIRHRAEKFQRGIDRRNLREYGAGILVALYLGFEMWRQHDLLMRIGFGLVIAGVLYLIWYLHIKGSARRLPAELGLASGLEFYRRELERQRDLVASVWSWYLGPVIPGLVFVMIAVLHASSDHLRRAAFFLAGFNVLVVFVFVFTWKLNQRGARRLQNKIDQLNALEGQR